MFAKFTGKGLCQRLYFNKVAFLGQKKETLAQMFSCEFSKISKNTSFLQNTSVRLLLFLAFQKQPLEVFYEKRCSWKFLKIHRKTPLVGEILTNTFFTEHLWLFRATLLKWGTANSVWKTSDEYSLSRNTNLRSTVQVYHFFLRQDKLSVYVFIGLYCLLREAAIRIEVFCKKRCS